MVFEKYSVEHNNKDEWGLADLLCENCLKPFYSLGPQLGEFVFTNLLTFLTFTGSLFGIIDF